MKMNPLSYIIKYLLSLLINFQAALYNKNLLLEKPSQSNTNYIIEKFHLHYRELALLQRILLVVTTTLLLKSLEELSAFTVTSLTNVC